MNLTLECDNVHEAHDLISRTNQKGGELAYCRICNRTYYLKHNHNGAPDNKEYGKLYFRWIVQPHNPLYYHVHPGLMNIRDIV